MDDLKVSGPWILQEVVDLTDASYVLTVGSYEDFTARNLINSLEALEFVLLPN